MKKSLLGHLYSHIKGSAEDVATMSLQYLLSSYESLQKSFNRLLASKLDVDFDTDTSYECQSVGEEQERPDMSGTDSQGKEVILCEAKFYAGLTSNQPLTYLKRLRDEKGVGLVFICPKDRMISLWDTVKHKCEKKKVTEITETCVSVDGVRMTILSWDEILLALTQTANDVEPGSLSDIEQVKGYCEQIVRESFIPFREEDLGALEARKYERLMYILDRVVDALYADPDIKLDTNGLRATPYRNGYKRFMYINNFGVDIRLDLEVWADDRYVDTPYWVAFRTKEDWRTPEDFASRVAAIPNTRKRLWRKEHIYLALDVPCGVVEEEVVASLKKQILDYMKLFE